MRSKITYLCKYLNIYPSKGDENDRFDSFDLLVSPVIPRVQLGSPGFTWAHQGSPGFTWNLLET